MQALPTFLIFCRYLSLSYSCTALQQGVAGGATGESAWRMAGQEVLWRRLRRLLHINVHPHPNGGQGDGVKHRGSI